MTFWNKDSHYLSLDEVLPYHKTLMSLTLVLKLHDLFKSCIVIMWIWNIQPNNNNSVKAITHFWWKYCENSRVWKQSKKADTKVVLYTMKILKGNLTATVAIGSRTGTIIWFWEHGNEIIKRSKC